MSDHTLSPVEHLRRVELSRRHFMALTGVSSLAALLAACAPPGVEPATGGEAPAAAESGTASASGGGTLIWLSHQEIAGLGPNDLGATMQTIVIMAIHSALVRYDTDYKMYPDAAEAVDVQPDGMKYTFKLRQGVKFHDGSELKASDV
nr:ABC transporter substrate-binding protein [Caldilineaceae bacterium]